MSTIVSPWNLSGPLNPNARWCAFGSALAFAVVGIGLATQPEALWVEYLGIAFHLALLPVVAELGGTTWTKAMGYAWLALDTVVGVLLIYRQNREFAMTFRLGGHILAGIWIAGTLRCLPPLPRWLGAPLALLMAGHTLLAPLLPFQRPYLLLAAGPLMVLWLAAVGIWWPQRGIAEAHAASRVASHRV